MTARVVELDPRNTVVARRLAAEAGLGNLEIVTGDASLTSQYADIVPAYLVLVCGVFGNMTNTDIERTIGYCTQLCATAGTVLWTRGRWAQGAPDLVPQVCAWFEERGFDRLWMSGPQHDQCCGAHRFTGTPAPLEEGASMFTFTGHDQRTGPARVARRSRRFRPTGGPKQTICVTPSCGPHTLDPAEYMPKLGGRHTVGETSRW